jgi:threonine synthase|tara:strand:- start:15835 stop:17217 length:1383 start_codon:yes stop_codon:yes gene_type:complete
MRYKSTRGKTKGVAFKDAVMMGLARDGGLLIPETIPDLSGVMADWQGYSYVELAFCIMQPFADDLPEEDLRKLIEQSYRSFDHELVAPLVRLDDVNVIELFHGPTLAFKDVALQFLGNLFEYILAERGEMLNILGATSGDTGSAAIAGVRGRENIDIFVMFPDGKTSPMQERQMTTVLDDNVHNIAVKGSFDDCQHILKSIFSDLEFKDTYHLGAVNSVNWARVLAQIVYYFFAWLQLERPAKFDVCVPTGNFGNIFAAYLARRMGLPIDRLVLATNENDILSVFFNSGVYRRGKVRFSLSPAMNIQVASNFERYLYYRMGESADKVNEFMASFSKHGEASLHVNTPLVDDLFRAGSTSDEDTLATIKSYQQQYGYAIDPHTAVGLNIAGKFVRAEVPMVSMATAHPAKFAEISADILPTEAISHPTLANLQSLPTRKVVLQANVQSVKDHIAAVSATRS